MAKFCKYCGKAIEEGKICNCPESLENAAKILNTVGATIETTKEVKDSSKRVLGLTKEYWKNPIETTKKVIEEKDNAFIISSGVVFILSVILNFFMIFGRVLKELNKTTNALGKAMGASFLELKQYNFVQNHISVFLYSLIFGISVLLIFSVVLILISKINKTRYTIKDICLVCIINIIPLTLCLIVGGILSLFVSYKIIFAIQILYVIVYIVIGIIAYNIIIGELNCGKDIIIYSIISFVGIIIISGILMKLIPSIVYTYEINGQAIGHYIDIMKKEIMKNMYGKNIFENIFEDIFEDIIEGIIDQIL